MKRITFFVLAAAIAIAFTACDFFGDANENTNGNGTNSKAKRPQATQGGVGIDSYISLIEEAGDYLIIYLSSVSSGQGTDYYGTSLFYWVDYNLSVALQDLDNPARFWNPVNSGRTATEYASKGQIYLSFEKVTGSRFSLTNTVLAQNYVFNEISHDTEKITTFPAGEYWFWPRPRATSTGIPSDGYIAMARENGGYTTFYITGVPFGRDDTYYGNEFVFMWGYTDYITLKDLDSDTTWTNPVFGETSGDERQKGRVYLSFNNVSGTRFSLSSSMSYQGAVTPVFSEVEIK